MHTASERVPATVPALLKLAWPIVVSRASQSVIGLCDALMVAHLGEAALAATTAGALNSFAFFILPMGTVFIVASFSSQFFGKGDLAGARRYAWYGLVVAGGTAVITLSLLPLLGRVLPWFGFTPEVLGPIHSYLSIRLLSSGIVVGVEALANYYGGLGNTRLPMLANLAAMVANVAGNWLLIDGRLGLPALGVDGAAWASVFASAVAFALLLTLFLLDGRRQDAVLPKLHLSELARMLKVGIPSGLNWFFEFFAFIFFINVVVAGLGTTPLAAFMSAMQLNSVSFMPAFAVASAGAIVVGQAIGAKAHDEVPGAVRLTFAVAGIWQAFVGLAYLLVPGLLLAPFARGPDAAAMLMLGAGMLRLSASWQLFDSAVMVLAESLRAAGDTAFTMWARIALAWLVFAPGSYITVRVFGAGEMGAMAWVVAYVGLLAVVLFFRFRAGAWRRIELTAESVPAHAPAPELVRPAEGDVRGPA